MRMSVVPLKRYLSSELHARSRWMLRCEGRTKVRISSCLPREAVRVLPTSVAHHAGCGQLRDPQKSSGSGPFGKGCH